MWLRTSIVMIFVAACGGDGGSGSDVDAGPDGPPTAEGSSAKQVYEAAWGLATAEAADAKLTQIHGEMIIADVGEVDPELQSSYWTLSFESEATDQMVSILYSRGTLTTSVVATRPHLMPIMTEWKDSTETVEALKTHDSYTPPTIPPPEYAVTMDLAIFTTPNESDPRYGIADPFWHLTVVHDPSGGTPVTEANVWAAYVNTDGMWLACNYLTGDCTQF